MGIERAAHLLSNADEPLAQYPDQARLTADRNFRWGSIKMVVVKRLQSLHLKAWLLYRHLHYSVPPALAGWPAVDPSMGQRALNMRPRDLPQLLKEATSEWIEDGAMRLSSSLAYYAIFSLAPLLVIVISIAGLVFGEEAARGQIAQEISALAGIRAGEAIQATVQASASEKTTSMLATIIGLVVLLFGASTVFAELKNALNTIWGVAVKPGRTFLTLVRDRFLSFSIVLAIGFLLLVSLVLSAVLAALGKYMSARLPLPAAVWQAGDFLVSFGSSARSSR